MDPETIKALILGVIQGFTEFLPVSSSGHLELGKELLDLDLKPEESLLLTVVLHFATALATMVVFWRDLLDIFKGLLAFQWNEHYAFVFKVALSMIPAVVIYFAFKEQIESLFDGKILFVGAMLIVTGILLLCADRARDTTKPVGWLHAVMIGIAQGIAILPGISRSGATISTSVLLGIDRARAARFSFLMVVPLILGDVAKEVLTGDFEEGSISMGALAIGFAAAFLTGLVACRWMIALVRRCQLRWFAFYCFFVGTAAIGWTLLVKRDSEPAPTPETALVSPSSTGLNAKPL